MLRLAAGIALLGGMTAVLHVAHVVAGHEWFSVYGPFLALALSGGVLALLGFGRASDDVGLFAALTGLFVMPEWLEGEIAAGHAVSWETLEGHGLSALAVLGSAVCLVVLWEAARMLTLLWPR
jgi:hypothetical protein